MYELNKVLIKQCVNFLMSTVPPIIEVPPPESASALEGGQIYERCEAVGLPIPEVTWTFNG